MVSKLALAVQECCVKAIEKNEKETIIKDLIAFYYQIVEGIGVHKSPALYGAFPIDPYSHTPAGKGAQQPGMTGQVKEDILCRFGELGVFVKNGILQFKPYLLKKDTFLQTSETFKYTNVKQQYKEIHLEKNTLCFTYCQVPIVYFLSNKNKITVIYNNTKNFQIDGLTLNKRLTKQLIERTGTITQLNVFINSNFFKSIR